MNPAEMIGAITTQIRDLQELLAERDPQRHHAGDKPYLKPLDAQERRNLEATIGRQSRRLHFYDALLRGGKA